MSIPGFEWLKEKVIVEEKIEKVKKLKPVADKMDCTLASLAIAWCIKNPHTTTAILGATNKDQLKQNLEALKLLPLLSEDVLNEIEDIVQTKPIQPEY